MVGRLYRFCLFLCSIFYILHIVESLGLSNDNPFDDVLNFTCPAVKQMQTRTLNNCTFQKESRSVTCEVLLAVSNTTKQYIHAALSFGVLANSTASDGNGSVWCVTLSRVRADYVKVNGSSHEQQFDTAEFLQQFQYALAEFSLKMPFSTKVSIPIGTVDLTSCTDDRHERQSCKVEVNVVSKVLEPNSINSKYQLKQIIKNLYMDVLGGVVTSINASLNEGGGSRELLELFSGLVIEKIYLTSSYFQDFSHKFFNSMMNLTSLSLIRCSIDYFDINSTDVPNLQYLDLSSNRLGDQFDISVHLSKFLLLKKLYLSSNCFTSVTLSELFLPQTLETLDLSQNNIETLGTNVISETLFHISILNFSRCSISVVDEEAFKMFPALTFLDISWNSIKILSPLTFKTLEHLRFVDVSNNQLQNAYHFEVSALDTLDMSQNMLSSPVDIISNGSVTTLDLSWNKIINWYKNTIFSNTEESFVQSINFSNNKISTITATMGHSLRKISLIDLGGNPIDCGDCATLEFQDWLRNEPRTHILINDVNKTVQCTSPKKWTGKPVLEVQFKFSECYDTKTYIIAVGTTAGILLMLMIIMGVIMWKQRKRNLDSRLHHDPKFTPNKMDALVLYSSMDQSWITDELKPTLQREPHNFQLFLYNADDLASYIACPLIDCILVMCKSVILVLTDNFLHNEGCLHALERAVEMIPQCRFSIIIIKITDSDEALYPSIPPQRILGYPRDPDDMQDFWAELIRMLGESLHNRNDRGKRVNVGRYLPLPQHEVL